METKVLLRLIRDDIKLLVEINESLISSEQLSSDEIEVALTRARSLVMEFEMLSKNIIHYHEAFTKAEERLNSVVQNEIDITEKKANLTNNESELIDLDEEEPFITKVEETVQKTRVEEIPINLKATQKEKAEKASKHDKPEEVLARTELLKEAVQSDIKILGEILEEKNQLVHDFLVTDRSERNFEEVSLKSIRDGIGINDRFLFMRELFGNDAEKYEDTISALDGFTAIEEAVSYLKQNFKWNKTDVGQKFLALVKRRFTK